MAATTRQTLLIAVSLMAVISVATSGESVGQLRYKRDLLDLCSVIETYTGSSCLDYNNYGCNCGFGTSTATPVDAVDRCCRIHDLCYIQLFSSCWLRPHFISYRKRCDSNSCTCTDSPRTSPCAFSTCSCDVRLGQCLKSATYNQTYKGWDRDLCVAS